MLRRIKLLYIIYNIFHWKRLRQNLPFYKILDIKKFYFSPISSKDFLDKDESMINHLKTKLEIQNTSIFKKVSKEEKDSLLNFNNKGFSILKQYINKDKIDEINLEIQKSFEKKEINFHYKNKIMFAFKKIQSLNKIANDTKLVELFSSLLSDKATPFQSINFFTGSEQNTHSDSIHMTTFPLGGLLGVWIALEDIDIDNGPLHYYPSSHKIPYFFNKEYENEGNYFLLGNKGYTEYEKMISTKIEDYNLTKKIFTAKAGDIIIWHANLLHGGEKHLNTSKTRKSVVFHYYAKNSICYHEITQRPTLF